MNGATATAGDSKWGNVINWGNQAALTWYSTVTQKPIQSPYPSTAMRNIFGTDFSGGPTIEGQTIGALGPLVVVGLAVFLVVMIARR